MNQGITRRTAQGRPWFFLWFGTIWFLAGTVLFIGTAGDALREKRYRREGLLVRGVVREKSVQRAERSGNRRTKYLVSYWFSTADNQTLDGSCEVSVEVWEDLQSGRPVEIEYLPGDPRQNRLAGDRAAQPDFVALVLGGLFAIAGAGIVLRSLRRIRRERQSFTAAWKRFVSTAKGFLGSLALVFAAILVSELLPPIKDFERWTERHQPSLLAVTITLTACGFVVFMGSILSMLIDSGKREASEAFTLRQFKDAWRTGRLFHNPLWRRRATITGGALVMGLGLFSLFVVLGPAWLKVLICGAVLYASVRLGWAYYSS